MLSQVINLFVVALSKSSFLSYRGNSQKLIERHSKNASTKQIAQNLSEAENIIFNFGYQIRSNACFVSNIRLTRTKDCVESNEIYKVR